MNVALRREYSGKGRGVLLDTLNVRAAARSSRAQDGIVRHLVLGYRPGWQAVSDLATIAGHVREFDPTISTYILPTNRRNPVLRRTIATRPTLVVSNGVIPAFRPARGKVYQGSVFPKVEELRLLDAAGVPVPRWALLSPGLRLDPAEWGEFVILKPTDRAVSSHGAGVQLMRTERVRYRAPHEYPDGHPGRRSQMLVQRFVDTGDHVTICRVLTLFGEPLYALADRTRDHRVPLTASDEEIERAPIASQVAKSSDAWFIYEERFLSLARAAHAAVPHVPLKGCDILQEAATGKLYVLELNCGGNTWHFSSAQQARERRRIGGDFELRRHQQFDAFRTAARVLAERTRIEAE
jgi:hypothetical protein